MTIPTLIDKQDTFEIVRDQIAAILAIETASQQALAPPATKDQWKFRVFTERSNPWEQFLNTPEADPSPLVCVWWDNSNFPEGKGNTLARQQATGIFNIDCYGFGISKDTPGGGHEAGDEQAAFAMQRAVRLVRNILMAAEYTYLGLQGNVGQRWPQSITSFQPQIDKNTAQQLVAARIALRVTFNEFSPQVAQEVLEELNMKVKRAEDGEVLVEAEFVYP